METNKKLSEKALKAINFFIMLQLGKDSYLGVYGSHEEKMATYTDENKEYASITGFSHRDIERFKALAIAMSYIGLLKRKYVYSSCSPLSRQYGYSPLKVAMYTNRADSEHTEESERLSKLKKEEKNIILKECKSLNVNLKEILSIAIVQTYNTLNNFFKDNYKLETKFHTIKLEGWNITSFRVESKSKGNVVFGYSDCGLKNFLYYIGAYKEELMTVLAHEIKRIDNPFI